MPGTGVTSDSTVSDAFADKKGGSGGGFSETHGPAVDTLKRFARAGEVGYGGTFGIEPRALHTLGRAPLADVDGGNERNGRAYSMARCSDAPPVRRRLRSSRYLCLLVAALAHFSGMPGRLSAQRASATWRRLCRRLSSICPVWGRREGSGGIRLRLVHSA